jgi:antitoxin (DNA-binding transcriptional repressor) of toxin-antitoxin stability system
MQTVTLDEAQKHLVELIRHLGSNGELLITEAEKPIAKLSSVTQTAGSPLIHPDVEAITGLIPPELDAENEYRAHSIEKQQ